MTHDQPTEHRPFGLALSGSNFFQSGLIEFFFFFLISGYNFFGPNSFFLLGSSFFRSGPIGLFLFSGYNFLALISFFLSGYLGPARRSRTKLISPNCRVSIYYEVLGQSRLFSMDLYLIRKVFNNSLPI